MSQTINISLELPVLPEVSGGIAMEGDTLSHQHEAFTKEFERQVIAHEQANKHSPNKNHGNKNEADNEVEQAQSSKLETTDSDKTNSSNDDVIQKTHDNDKEHQVAREAKTENAQMFSSTKDEQRISAEDEIDTRNGGDKKLFANSSNELTTGTELKINVDKNQFTTSDDIVVPEKLLRLLDSSQSFIQDKLAPESRPVKALQVPVTTSSETILHKQVSSQSLATNEAIDKQANQPVDAQKRNQTELSLDSSMTPKEIKNSESLSSQIKQALGNQESARANASQRIAQTNPQVNDNRVVADVRTKTDEVIQETLDVDNLIDSNQESARANASQRIAQTNLQVNDNRVVADVTTKTDEVIQETLDVDNLIDSKPVNKNVVKELVTPQTKPMGNDLLSATQPANNKPQTTVLPNTNNNQRSASAIPLAQLKNDNELTPAQEKILKETIAAAPELVKNVKQSERSAPNQQQPKVAEIKPASVNTPLGKEAEAVAIDEPIQETDLPLDKVSKLNASLSPFKTADVRQVNVATTKIVNESTQANNDLQIDDIKQIDAEVADEITLQSNKELNQVSQSISETLAKAKADTTTRSDGETRSVNSMTSRIVTESNESKVIESQTLSQQQTKHVEKVATEIINVNHKNFAQQMKEKVMVMVSQKLQSVDIQLDPPELGNVHVRVNLQGEQAMVNFMVQQPQAKDALEQHMNKLREMLEESGIDLGDTDVQQQFAQHDESLDEDGEFSSASGADDNISEESLGQVDDRQVVNVQSVGIDYFA
ncbi:flagellar hook-length control protein FliK [Thalassotalea eurytherma]|uniref:Flagellar hook-length control protein FliK n=1 Tax=Thalassotalea eurytherma TaxID=1144278 RepID=A0ABQ6H6B8_9GAMM|nr:flagellar hook-length control protein FliK [Thalassotalea eurytherma]GLX83152.1 flagellar hook-length control protein FliK [Thalassotalea eurytherma]